MQRFGIINAIANVDMSIALAYGHHAGSSRQARESEAPNAH
jgi:hypothetical protein